MAFILAQGTLSLPKDTPPTSARISVISAADGKPLHDGVKVAEGGTFTLDFPSDPRGDWGQGDLVVISFGVQRGDGPVTVARGPSGVVVWALKDFPMKDLLLTATVESSDDAAKALDAIRTNTAQIGDVVAKLGVLDSIGANTAKADRIAADVGGIREKLGALGETKIPLALNARGAEVRALQDRLQSLGCHVPAYEREAQLFGAGTREALWTLQAKHDVSLTGVLDDATRAALARAVTGGGAWKGGYFSRAARPRAASRCDSTAEGSAAPLGCSARPRRIRRGSMRCRTT